MPSTSKNAGLSVVPRGSRGSRQDGQEVPEQQGQHRDRARVAVAEEGPAEEGATEAETESAGLTRRRIRIGTRAPSNTRTSAVRPPAIDPRLIPARNEMADLLVHWVLKQPQFAHLRARLDDSRDVG